MRVQILGAHQGETRDTRFISILVGDHLAIDAGGLTSSLSLDQQFAVDAILITHRHFDHIKDLPMLAHNIWERKALQIYCTEDTRQMIQRHIFNNEIWPAMHEDSPPNHSVVFHDVKPESNFKLLGYEVCAVPLPHTVPSVGYQIKRDGKSMFYTSDTRSDGEPRWTSLRPDVLIMETTMSNRADADAERFGHTTPMSLGRELRAFHDKQGYYPRVICVHMNPKHDKQIRIELAALSKELQADITASHEGMVIEV